MALFIFIVILIALYQMRYQKNGYFSDYLSREVTTAIKGIFILLIFCTHAEQYIDVGSGLLATIYKYIRLALGQSIVTCFFFYSGYGILEAIKKKKESYLASFTKKRILKTYVNFLLTLLVFIVIALLGENEYKLADYLLSFIGWSGVGNSAWFNFDILSAYILTYICFKTCKDNKKSLIYLSILSIIFVVVMYFTRESRFYNTFLTFVIGMWYSYYRDDIDDFFSKKQQAYWPIALGLIILYGLSGIALMNIYEQYEFLYIPLPIIFIIGFVLLTKKFCFNNKILQFYGSMTYSMFMLMRVPMNLLENTALVNNQYLFTIICFIITTIIAYLFNQLLNIIDNKLFNK